MFKHIFATTAIITFSYFLPLISLTNTFVNTDSNNNFTDTNNWSPTPASTTNWTVGTAEIPDTQAPNINSTDNVTFNSNTTLMNNGSLTTNAGGALNILTNANFDITGGSSFFTNNGALNISGTLNNTNNGIIDNSHTILISGGTFNNGASGDSTAIFQNLSTGIFFFQDGGSLNNFATFINNAGGLNFQIGSGTSVNNNTGATIINQGQITTSSAINNQGTIINEGTIDYSGVGQAFTNNGVFEGENAADNFIGSVINKGTVNLINANLSIMGDFSGNGTFISTALSLHNYGFITADNVDLTGSTLTLHTGSLVLDAGTIFDLIDYSGSLTSVFSTLNLPTLTAGLVWSIEYGVQSINNPSLESVQALVVEAPEPGTYAILGSLLGVALLLKLRSRLALGAL